VQTILIITLGTRDIQIKKEAINSDGLEQDLQVRKTNNPDDVLYPLAKPREAGQYIDQNFEKINDFIAYPIAQPAIDYVLFENRKIDKILIISTDQSKISGVSSFHLHNDTIEYAKILKKLIHRDYKTSQIKSIKNLILNKEGIIYHDNMFDYFDDIIKQLCSSSENQKIFLSLQGGINAVNTAVLLRSIEYGNEVEQIAKPELSEIAFSLKFPRLFKKSLQKQKVLHSLQNYNYSTVLEIDYSPVVSQLAAYSIARLSFDFERAISILRKLLTMDEKHRNFYHLQYRQLQFSESFKDRQREVYLAAKVALFHRQYADFLSRMFTMAETLLKPEVARILGGEIVFNSVERHPEWNELLSQNPEIVRHLEQCKYNGTPLHYKSPNRTTYKEIYFFHLDQQNQKPDPDLIILLELLENLSSTRNKAVHDLSSISMEDINQNLKKENSKLEDLIEVADRFFEVKNMGIYDEINVTIEQEI
jgi:hypothetical protein